MKLVVLTGISSGLGRCLAKQLGTKELYLLCIGRRFTTEFVVSNQRKLFRLDLTDTEDISNLRIGDLFPLEEIQHVIYINNAAQIEPLGNLSEVSDTDLQNSIAVNVTSPMLLTKKLYSLGKPLKVINISSGAANRPIKGWAAYCAGKSAAQMFFNTIALDLGIEVINFDPGVMDTPMQQKIDRSNKKLQDPNVVANTILKEYL
jgi:benzil reductase ((S)-benzoin forming)